jgi:hypothetical protein
LFKRLQNQIGANQFRISAAQPSVVILSKHNHQAVCFIAGFITPSQQQICVGADRERRNAVGISKIQGEVEMAVTKWEPSFFGRQLTGSLNWHLCLDGLELVLTTEGRTHRVHVEEETAYRIQPGMLWTDITLFPGQGAEVKADGLPNTQGAALTHVLNSLLAEKRIREDVAFLLGTLKTIEQWLEFKTSQEQHCHQARRWFTHEQQATELGGQAIATRAVKQLGRFTARHQLSF